MQSSKPPATIFSWAGVGAPVFGGSAGSTPSSATKTDKGAESSGEEEGGQDDTHDPHFEPIVALPDAIEVRTGEEDEEKRKLPLSLIFFSFFPDLTPHLGYFCFVQCLASVRSCSVLTLPLKSGRSVVLVR